MASPRIVERTANPRHGPCSAIATRRAWAGDGRGAYPGAMSELDLDWLALQQIQRLFRTRDCTVWELVPPPAPEGAVPIHRADGAIVAYARPVA